MAADGAPLTEADVRERVSLRHPNLADVRSLSLPGTYHEKITHLGNSLKSFVRLKSLDLSRNALTSLEGLECLTYLEKLNLYFNCISSLSEVFRLHTLTALKDVDLRLNPVLKNESDYRLFVVHMLPNLRQLVKYRSLEDGEAKITSCHADLSPAEHRNLRRLQVLVFLSNEVSVYRIVPQNMNDRPVRDNERKASLLHFTTDHAYKFKKPSVALEETATGRSVHPRAVYVNTMSKKCLLMDADDEAVLNLVSECEWDLSKPPAVTGSSKRVPAVEFHDLNNIYRMEKNTGRHSRSSVSPPHYVLMQKTQEHMPKMQEYMLKDAISENRNVLKARELDREYRIAQDVFGQGPEKRKIYSGVSFLGTPSKELPMKHSNLKFQDKAKGSEKMATHVSFTPHPGPPGVTTGSDQKKINSKDGKPQGASQLENKVLCEGKPIEQLLDLVDKHWAGSKSLHKNEQFLSQAETILSAIQKPVPTDQQKPSPSETQELNKLLLENKTLQTRISEQEQQYNGQVNILKSDLDSTKKDMDILKEKIDKLLEENTALKVQNSKLEQTIQSDTAPLQITKLEAQSKQITDENASLKQRLENFNKMQELTEMLQESHRTLVSTNERLLKELDETRSKHKAEVEQLNWNYNQLKKTMDPPAAAAPAPTPSSAPAPTLVPPSNINNNRW